MEVGTEITPKQSLVVYPCRCAIVDAGDFVRKLVLKSPQKQSFMFFSVGVEYAALGSRL